MTSVCGPITAHLDVWRHHLLALPRLPAPAEPGVVLLSLRAADQAAGDQQREEAEQHSSVAAVAESSFGPRLYHGDILLYVMKIVMSSKDFSNKTDVVIVFASQ